MKAESIGQQGDNRLPTGLDDGSLVVLREWTVHLEKSFNHKGIVQVLNAVVRLCCDDPERGFVAVGDDADGYGFTNKEVAALLKWKLDDPYHLKRVNQSWQSLTTTEWERYSAGIRQRLDEIDSPWEIIPDQIKSVGRTPNLFFLRYKKFEQEQEQDRPKTKKNRQAGNLEMRYYLDEKNSRGFLALLLRKGLPRSGIMHRLTMAVVLFAMFLGILVALSAFTLTGTFYAFVILMFMVWGGNRFLNWMNLYTQGPMVPAPSMLQAGKYDDLMFEWKRTQYARKGGNDDTEMMLVLSRYSGVCPICGGVVRACGGGVEFKERIVGRCEGAPIEHVFSFDPTTFRGYPLREWVQKNMV